MLNYRKYIEYNILFVGQDDNKVNKEKNMPAKLSKTYS